MTLLYPSFIWLLLPLVIFFVSQKKKTLMLSTHLIIMGLIVLTLTRPVIEKGLQESTIEAKDIVIAIDVSYSMKAKDIAPTRYAFAKETIKAVLKENAKDNIMLIAFTSNPLILSPPTTDHTLISIALESLNTEYILTKGTSLKKLFALLSDMPSTDKDLILITDGGENESAEKLAAQLQKTDLRLTVLALGSKQGITIEKEDGSLLKDKENNLVVSRINPMLSRLTSLVGGNYLTASSSPRATASALHHIISAQEQTSHKIKKIQYHYTELYQIPLMLALILFLMLHTRASKYLLVFFALSGIQLQASVWEGVYLNNAYNAYKSHQYKETEKILRQIESPSLQSRLALGNTYYKEGKYQKAIAVYGSIRTTKPEIKQRLFYNTANAYALQGKYAKAKIYYTKTLQLGEDNDALYNLGVIVLKEEKQDAGLGIAHPKSQNTGASKSKQQDTQKEEHKAQRDEDQPSSGSGSGGQNKKEKTHDKKKQRLILDNDKQEQPLSSKVYELINKGYIRETQPW